MSKRLEIIGISAAVIIFSTIIIACSKYTKAAEEKRMVVLSHESGGDIVYDCETGIEYWVSLGHYNYGNLSVLLNENGKPLIFERN